MVDNMRESSNSPPIVGEGQGVGSVIRNIGQTFRPKSSANSTKLMLLMFFPLKSLYLRVFVFNYKFIITAFGFHYCVPLI